jgi:hypothetical protein
MRFCLSVQSPLINPLGPCGLQCEFEAFLNKLFSHTLDSRSAASQRFTNFRIRLARTTVYLIGQQQNPSPYQSFRRRLARGNHFLKISPF